MDFVLSPDKRAVYVDSETGVGRKEKLENEEDDDDDAEEEEEETDKGSRNLLFSSLPSPYCNKPPDETEELGLFRSYHLFASSTPPQSKSGPRIEFAGVSSSGGVLEAVAGGGFRLAVGGIEREHMFDKVVTPSDVGKLNRLVIPKQYAERFFPLDASSNEKGLLLSFEDRNGKPWRFRYSYWTSSQSYVMTKGWSRFVKEKRLDAGDVVSFHRGVGESSSSLLSSRFYIDWRHRPPPPDCSSGPPRPELVGWSAAGLPPFNPPPIFQSNHRQSKQHIDGMNHIRPYHHQHRDHIHQLRQRSAYNDSHVSNACPRSITGLLASRQVDDGRGGHIIHTASSESSMAVVQCNVAAAAAAASTKRLRLFGVNMECPADDCSPAPGGSQTSVVPCFTSEPSNILSSSSSSSSSSFSSSSLPEPHLSL